MKSQIDYLLVFEALKAKFVACGIERRGMWNIAKLTGNALQPFAGITGPADAASDHAAVWAEFDL